MKENGLPYIDRNKCTGCGVCVDKCPNNVLVLHPPDIKVFIACNTQNKGVITKKICSNGCILCKRCVKECPANALSIVNNRLIYDYNKCISYGSSCNMVCKDKCPSGVISIAYSHKTQIENG